jgi:hypothetical protein
MKNCIKKTYVQESDCCGNVDVVNTITIMAEDGGGGTYVVLEAPRWAMDSDKEIDELCKELKDVLKIKDIWCLGDTKVEKII